MARHSERSGEGERELRYPAIAVRSEVIGAWSIESLIVTAAPNLFAFLTAASVRLVLPSQSGPSRLPRISRICWTISGSRAEIAAI
jgi:hypothetical protein